MQEKPNLTPARKTEVFEAANHNPLFNKFWQELRAGKGLPKGEADVNELVEFYTNVLTMSALSEKEVERIKKYLKQYFRGIINAYNEIYNTLINDEILLVDTRQQGVRVGERNIKGFQYTLFNISQLSEEAEEHAQLIESLTERGVRPLTTEEKIKLLSDPEFFSQAQYHAKRNSSLNIRGFGHGSRRLIESKDIYKDVYYESREAFLEEVRATKERTGNSHLRVLDVGSNSGYALKDMEDLIPDIETFNMTIDDYPSLYGHHVIHHPAEMMPEEFEESMDMIESKFAFLYFVYSDIALTNVVKALTVGGVARIDYQIGEPTNLGYLELGTSVSALTKQELQKRQEELWNKLRDLVEKGYIDIDAPPYSSVNDALTTPNGTLKMGFLRIVKKKSTKEVSL